MRPQTVIRSRLDRDPNALDLCLLREANGLVDVRSSESRHGVVELSDEVVAVIFWHGHEGPSHDTEEAQKRRKTRMREKEEVNLSSSENENK